MADGSFGPGWPNCDRSHIVTLARADGLRIALHADVADLVAILMDLTEALGYDIVVGETWGYACRAIAGTSVPSNHSWGTAVDINSLQNPQRRPLTTNLPDDIVQLWASHGFRWGGSYKTSTPDPMHFEFMGTASQARQAAADLRAFFAALGAQVPTPAPAGFPKPAPRPYPGEARMGDRGPHVRVWQHVLRERGYAVAVDGIFGPATNHVVWHWQGTHHPPLTVDSIAGQATWHSLLYA
jgi:hypothetical protein